MCVFLVDDAVDLLFPRCSELAGARVGLVVEERVEDVKGNLGLI